MKLVKRISFFMALSVFMLGLGGFGALKAEDYFYPNRYAHGALLERLASYESSPSRTVKQPEEAEEEQVIETAAADAAVVTADTHYLVERVDLADGTATEEEEAVPVMYIGLDREELLSALASYEDNPPLSELEQGFTAIELTAFSRDRVVVCKYYREETPKGFYLMVADHFIIVCEEDRQSLFMNTDILLERLPDSLQREIMAGKFVENEEELYLFLESYSS